MSEEPNTPDQDEIVMAAGAVYDGAYTLLIADFSDTGSAREAYDALKEVEDGRHVQIEGVIVVKRAADGQLDIEKATDHTTRRGLKWGIVGGAVLGLIFPRRSSEAPRWSEPPERPQGRWASSATAATCPTSWNPP